MDIKKTQAALKAAGYDPGTIDGDLGPNTFTGLLSYAANHDIGSLGVLLGRAMAADFPKYQINTGLRIAHFIAQAAVETQWFRYLSELGSGKDANHDGYDDYLQQYDFRKDLGDSHVGDGDKYRGRGLFQLTGLFNYTVYATKLSLPLITNPAMAAQPEVAVLTACLYWSDRKINGMADADDCQAVTKKINGGLNAYSDRLAVTTKLKALLM